MKSIADPRLNLLTVLNVQSAKPSKRTAPASRDWHALARKAAKRSNAPTASTATGRLRAELAEQIVTAADHQLKSPTAKKGPAAKKGKGSADAGADAKTIADQAQDEQDQSAVDSDDEGETAGTTQDPFIRHFGAESTLVNGHEAEALSGDRSNWAKGKAVVPALGEVLWTRPRDTAVEGAGTLDTEAAQKIVRFRLSPPGLLASNTDPIYAVQSQAPRQTPPRRRYVLLSRESASRTFFSLTTHLCSFSPHRSVGLASDSRKVPGCPRHCASGRHRRAWRRARSGRAARDESCGQVSAVAGLPHRT